MKDGDRQVLGVQRMSLERRFVFQACVATALAVVSYHIFVKPEAHLLNAARAELNAQSKDLADTVDLPQVADDLPRAIRQMNDRKQELMGRFAISADASKLYDLIGQLANQCGVRADRIDPVRGSSGRAGAPGGKDKNRLALETYGYSIEAVGSYEKLAQFTDLLSTQTGVTRVSNVVFEPLDSADGQPRLRANITTVHYKLPAPKKDAGGTKAEPGGRS